ncbi:transglycosylase domain-containing protein [Roseomonas fluvialis]|uniref:transglycosylase domain-containing protein n=1 Tax=Roseomonas fluvialis TaxID=1750527 RepID=UPI001FCDB7F1|nr:transglycosylase domain-containing protein [Roseomonas fluvialis]
MNPPDTIPHEQYFPTYRFRAGSSEAALKEYEAAVKILENDERIFAASTGFFIGGAGILFAALSQANSEIFTAVGVIFGDRTVLYIGWLLIIILSMLAATYFADKTAAVVHAARKVIVLRRMLGISYGSVDMVLPSNRVEGADEPFQIRMFDGWLSYKILPAYIIGIFSALLSVILFSRFISFIYTDANSIKSIVNLTNVPFFQISMTPILAGILSFVLVVGAFRAKLYESNENIFWSLAAAASALMRFQIKSNWPYVLYRIKLAVEESRRIGLPLEQFYPILTHVEDRSFFSHRGFSIRTLVAPIIRYARSKKLSGGSTITQQFVRSNFFISYRKKYRRKIAELLFSLWAERAFEKKQILDYYLVSVRFSKNVVGVDKAFQYFFPQIFVNEARRRQLTNVELFFLVERLSSIGPSMNIEKISAILGSLLSANIIKAEDCISIVEIYDYQISEGRIAISEAPKVKSLKDRVLMLRDPSGHALYQLFGPPPSGSAR